MEMNKQTPLSKSLILLLAITCGVVVANMYYIQPIGTKVAANLSVNTSAVGLLTMLTELGYAFRIIIFSSIRGCRRSTLIDHSHGGIICTILISSLFAPNFALFAVASFLIGLLSIVPQIIIPYGAVLPASSTERKNHGDLISLVY